MKKVKRLISTLMIFVLSSMLVITPVSAAGADGPNTGMQNAEVQKTNSITLDGDLTESAWSDKHSLSKQIVGSSPEIDAKFATTWDNEKFYLGVEVIGVNGYSNFDNDSITYYFSPYNYRGTPYSANDFQVQIFDKGATVKAGAPGMGKNDILSTSDITVKYKSQANGYTMEIAMPWEAVGTMPKAGNNTMGFDIMAFSNGENTVMEWSGGNWKDTTQNGTLYFVCDGSESMDITSEKPLYSVGETVNLNITGAREGDSVAIFKKGEETSISNAICTKSVSGAAITSVSGGAVASVSGGSVASVSSDAITTGQVKFTKEDFSNSSNPTYKNGLIEGEYVAVLINNSKNAKCTFQVAIILGEGWYKGDNHMHSTFSDGTRKPAEVASKLKNLGMNYATLTDHNTSGGKTGFESQGTTNFVPVIGEEVTRGDGHFLAYGIQSDVNWGGTPQEAINRVLDNNPGKSFCYIAHPTWSVDKTQGGDWEWHDWSVTGYTGLEVWNAYYPHNYDEDYSITAFQKWDELNNQGKHLYGMCNTDAHDPDSTLGFGWNVNYMKSLTRDNVLYSMKTGNFYGTNGPSIDFTINGNIMGSDIKLTGSTVSIYLSATCASNLNKVNLIKNGEIIKTWNPGTTTWSTTLNDMAAAPGDFFRMTAEGKDLFAFSNPIFIVKPRITTKQTSYTAEQAIQVSFSNNDGSGFPGEGGTAKDWIGIYKEGDIPGTSGTSSISWCYLNGTQTAPASAIKNGTISLEKLPVGNYFIGFFSNDGFTEIGDRIEIKVTDLQTPQISTAKTIYASSQTIPVSFDYNITSGSTSTVGTVKDWIGIYKEGENPGVNGVTSISWCYLNGEQTVPSEIIKKGTVNLKGLPVGNYYIGFFSNDGYTDICDRIKIKVTDDPTPYITTDKSTYTSGQSISIKFFNNNGTGAPATGGTASDWMAIYKKGVIPGGAGGPVAWLYLNGTQLAPTSVVKSGTLVFSGLPEGEYFATMLSCGVFVNMCDTVSFTVTSPKKVTIPTLVGGSIIADQSIASAGTSINLTIKPEPGKQLKAGSLKYNDGTDHTITGTSFTMPAADVTVTAEFEAIPSSTYTVRFNLTGGTRTGGGELIQTIAKGGSAIAPTVTRNGFTFKGWDKAFTNITGDITVVAQYTEQVTPDNNNGSGGSYEKPVNTTTNADNSNPLVITSRQDNWNTVVAKITGSSSGNVVVDMNGNTKVPNDVFEAIQGKEITMTFHVAKGIEWIINGKDLHKMQTEWKDLDLGVNLNTAVIPKELITGLVNSENASTAETNPTSTVQLSLAYEGSFGFPATLSINLGNTNTGRTANLYYYNPTTKKLELQSTGTIDANGLVQLNFTHASDYVILINNGDTLKGQLDKITVTPKKTLYIKGTIDQTSDLTVSLTEELKSMLANGTGKHIIAYKTSDPNVASVSNTGKVNALKEGKTTITTTITINGETKSFKSTINVKKAYIKLSKSLDHLKKGQSYRYQAIGYGVEATNITWITTEKSIVAIDKVTGKAKAKSAGVDYVVAKAGRIRAKLKVTVK